MHSLKKVLIIGVGVFMKLLNRAFPVSQDVWVFGSQDGSAYADNSKYFFEYVVHNHTEIKAIWLTRSKNVIDELNCLGLKVHHNLSIKGVWYSVISSVAIFCTSRNDLWFVYHKKRRKIVNLWHGMPMKKIVFDYPDHSIENNTFRDNIWSKYVAGIQHKQVSLIISTSDFFSNILKSSFRNNNIIATGQPRTDVFFSWKKDFIKSKLGLNNEDIIVTYMPTHRAYGQGELNPLIFNNNDLAIDCFKKNRIKIIWKFHKNMIPQHLGQGIKVNQEVFKDMTHLSIDPQELLFVSDILITDYSSCYVDFLFLKRPIIFYLYDNYESDDNELYYQPEDHNIGCIAKNEDELLKMILNCEYKTEPKIEYHKYLDNNSSQRTFKEITRLL